MNIIEAIKHPQLFRPFLGEDLSSWTAWLAALRVLYGLRIPQPYHSLIKTCTGRDPAKMPKTGFDTTLFLTGRRSGKSRISAIITAFEAILAGHEHKLAKGEFGVVPVLAPSKSQARIVSNYVRGIFYSTDLLKNEIVNETKESFELKNRISIEILAGDWRTIRGFTLVAAVIDEAAFFGLDSDSKIRSDQELVRAIKPALASIQGRLIAISSPYAKRGWCHSTHKRHWGQNDSNTLVWNCPSRTMNPSLSQQIIDDALAEDYQAAQSEYMGLFRDDVGIFLPPEVIERCVVAGQFELLPRPSIPYFGFADLSGGRVDDATLAIGHKQDRKVIVDFLRRWKPPFSPQYVIGEMVQHLRRYSLRRVTGDNYAAEFVAQGFEAQSIRYRKSEKNKSALYLELLPRICSQEIELPDDETLIKQLCSLERRTRSGGKDIIDHPPGGHDDLANAIAGVADIAASRQIKVGAFGI